jgi:MFS family permease
MDHAGAVLGPLIASALLTWGSFSLRTIFLIAIFPAVLGLAILFFGIQESPHKKTRPNP